MNSRGFTLLELLVALTIVATLAAASGPSLARLVARGKLESASQELLSGLALARKTALATGTTTTVCPTVNERRCSFLGRKWMIFSNQPGGLVFVREAGEPILREWPLPAAVNLSGTRGYVAYLPQLRAASTATLSLQNPALPGEIHRVIVSQTGRPRLSRERPAS
jgi:prepilin-type N-terminal cleavage/methylation domain-containing protein